MRTKSHSQLMKLPKISTYLTLMIVMLFITKAYPYQPVTITQAPKTVVINKGSPRFEISLGYKNVFDIQIESIDGVSDVNEMCVTTAGEVNPISVSQGAIVSLTDQEVSFDNVVLYKNYIFALESSSLTIVAIRKDPDGNGKRTRIKSEFSNVPAEKDEFYEAYMTLDDKNGVLYILTNRDLLSYPLEDFFTAIENRTRLPSLHKFAEGFKSFGNIETMKYYQENLYIVADSVVHIWFGAKNGDLAVVNTIFDKEFFHVDLFSAVDITFKDHYAFILDSFNGVYAVDISKASKQLFGGAGLKFEVKKGQLIEAIGDSLNVITSSAKMTFLYEHMITINSTSVSLLLNRQVELFQSVTEIQSDGTFLFILTGFYNIIARHSVPGEFNSPELQDYLYTYWPAYNIQAFYASKNESVSEAVIIQGDQYTLYTFMQKDPTLTCETATMEEQEYDVHLNLLQTTCHKKVALGQTGFDTICENKETIRLLVASDSTVMGDISWSETTSQGLALGIILMVLLVLVFWYLIRRYRTQSRKLEDQIKFKKFKDVDDVSGHEEEAGQKI